MDDPRTVKSAIRRVLDGAQGTALVDGKHYLLVSPEWAIETIAAAILNLEPDTER